MFPKFPMSPCLSDKLSPMVRGLGHGGSFRMRYFEMVFMLHYKNFVWFCYNVTHDKLEFSYGHLF